MEEEGGLLAVLTPIAVEAVGCNACFDNRPLLRSFVDLPQPRFVGPHYESSCPRVAWVMINPGAGRVDTRNRQWRARLWDFRRGETGLASVFAEQRKHMPHWNQLMPFIGLHGLDTDDLALVNVAWCASHENQYPEDMLDRCWDLYTGRWLAALEPAVVVLSGGPAQEFKKRVLKAVPKAKIYDTFHYAYWSRPFGRSRATARAEELRQELGR